MTALETRWLLIGAGLALLLGMLVLAGVAWRRRRRRNLDRRLRDVCQAVLANFVIPDGNGGEIEVQYALLTRRGIVLADVKDVDGHVFGSEGMADWTVIARNRRFTFPNPQPGLWDRVAAVKRLVPEDVPVTGYIAFTARARFSKGQPRGVVDLETLLGDLARESASATGGNLRAAWDCLRDAAISARLDHLISEPAKPR